MRRYVREIKSLTELLGKQNEVTVAISTEEPIAAAVNEFLSARGLASVAWNAFGLSGALIVVRWLACVWKNSAARVRTHSLLFERPQSNPLRKGGIFLIE